MTMLKLMDRLFIALGFNSSEIKSAPHRGWLYAAMIYLLGIATAFGFMALVS